MKKTGLTLSLIFAGCFPASIVYAQAAPATAAPSLTRVSFIQLMDTDFKARDVNGDGTVSRAEIEAFERETALQKLLLENSALFSRLDVDQNGSLTALEFQKLATNPTMPDITSIMQRFDKNRDQKITIVEYRTATLVRFDDLDADKDGVIDQKELSASQSKQNSLETSR
jgi:Ca2+-binding EF-hand superfamily protein